MEAIRVMPCLDMANGRVVKGVNFVQLRDAGDPAEVAAAYTRAGADELGFLDINATVENRGMRMDVLRKTCEAAGVPVTAGGGLKSLEDIEAVLTAGAAKALVNTAMVKDPEMVRAACEKFGGARIVAAIDARRDGKGGFSVMINGGKTDTGIDAVAWAKRVEALGVGCILLTSLDGDGTRDGYDLALTRAVADAVQIPVVASGGAGSLEDFYRAVVEGGARVVLAASLFHFGVFTVGQVKEYLAQRGIPVLPIPEG